MKKTTKPAARHEQSGSAWQRFVRSIWLFPAVATIVLLLLTAFKINGSSMGVYHTLFDGATPDSQLIAGKPRPIRSDEWVVNTQMTIAQAKAGYPRVNPHIGHGEDVSLIVDVPYKEWSTVFKPHNLVFFVLPFEYAFAFKWWFMAYLLAMSCYFFVITLLPKQKWLAVTLSVALLFSPLVQWWYQYITLGPIYYSLFAATIVLRICHQKKWQIGLLWSVLLAYVLVCFALVLYPPFQIACGLAVFSFLLGYMLQQRRLLPGKVILQKLALVLGACLVTGVLVLTFIKTRSDVVHTITNTAYPGQRLQASGGYNIAHTFSGNLNYQLQFTSKANYYQIPTNGLDNQSEDSNFVLFLPFLFLPSLYILWQDRRAKRPLDLPLLFVNAFFLVLMMWMFVAHVPVIGKLLLLNRVPHTRLLIGLGVLSFIQFVLVARHVQDKTLRLPRGWIVALYAVLVFAAELLLGRHIMHITPGYIHWRGVIALSLPVPVIVYLLLKRRLALSGAVFALFMLCSTALVNPFYRGTATLTATPISQAIQHVAAADPNGVWAVETSYLENFAYMNGANSLAGTYFYPQLGIWHDADPNGANDFIYNRYAHVNFLFDRDPNRIVATRFVMPGPDHFGLITEACGTFAHDEHISYILTNAAINDSCTHLLQTVRYPLQTFYIYKVS